MRVRQTVLPSLALVAVMAAAAGCTASRGDGAQPAGDSASATAALPAPGRYIEERPRFYAEVFHKGRFHLFGDKARFEAFEATNEVMPPVRSMVAAGPVINGRKTTVVFGESNPRDLVGGADEAKVRDTRILRTFRARWGLAQ